ncbi:MAG: hypothetical protein J6P16_04800 [Eubacterium sp.]|nr:hypothetical protein [Eubacterium sp.]
MRPEHTSLLHTRYISERIRETLRAVRNHAMTSVVAPMGYGKTTAINWYLENEKKSIDAIVLRISIYSDNLIMFWRQFQKAFAATEIADSVSKMDFPDTKAGLFFFMEMMEDYLNKCHRVHYIFIDDYHLLMHPAVTRFFTVISAHAPDCLHIIVASRNVFISHSSVVELGNRLYLISKADLSLNYTELSSYCRLCGVKLDVMNLKRFTRYQRAGFPVSICV